MWLRGQLFRSVQRGREAELNGPGILASQRAALLNAGVVLCRVPSSAVLCTK